MEMFTGEILDKVELNNEDKEELKKFFDTAVDELQSNAHELAIISEESKLFYAKSGLGFDSSFLSPKEGFYWTEAHLLIKDGQMAAACLMTDFYEDCPLGSSYRFDLGEWIKSVDINDNKRKIYCFDDNVGIGFNNVMIDDNGEVELHLHEVYKTKQEKSPDAIEEKANMNTEQSHLEMLRITRDLMSCIEWPRKKEQKEL